MKTVFSLLTIVLILAVVFVPWLVIWSLNTLFPMLNIPFNFWTWLAVMIMYGFFNGKVAIEKNK